MNRDAYEPSRDAGAATIIPMHTLWIWLLWAVVSAPPPLTPPQRVQLDTASDRSSLFDEGALYPLLHNALQWEDGDEAGAAIPDYSAIREDPVKHRGELFLIEGLYAGRSKSINNLTRPGPWDGKLKEWVIVTDVGNDQVAVVYLVDPPAPPAAKSKVRVPARFYKILKDVDQKKRPTDFLLFIGRSATVQTKKNTGTTPTGLPLIAMLLLLVVAWFVFRKKIRNKPHRSGFRRQHKTPNDGGTPDPDTLTPDLPDDPADALQALEHHSHESD